MSSSLTSQRYSTSSQNPSVVPNASEIIYKVKYGYSFQSREILQRVVLGEQQRLKEEQTLWRFGAAVLGSYLGLSDGFQLTDLFLGMASSTIAATAHEILSNEDKKFLERCQLLWLVGNHSPIELSQRIGQARSRILFYNPRWQAPCIFNHHQVIRGEHLVPLGNAGNYAPGFADQVCNEALIPTGLKQYIFSIASHPVASQWRSAIYSSVVWFILLLITLGELLLVLKKQDRKLELFLERLFVTDKR